MKERLITLGLALGALLLFYLLLFPKPSPPTQQPSQPLSTDAGSDGEQALWRWLKAERVPVSSLRYRYDRLSQQPGAAPAGNLLISVMPHRLPLRADEWQPLQDWIRAGNTLLILAALDDTPLWSIGSEGTVLHELTRLSDISFWPAPEEQQKADHQKTDGKPLRQRLAQAFGNPRIEVRPVGEHPLLANVQLVLGSSQLPASRWLSAPVAPSMPLQLLRQSDGGAPVMWLARQGEGQVIVSSLLSAFTNQQIDQADNAQLLSNIIAWSRAPNGAVIFDDSHQGLTAYYDPHAFFADPRLHHTLLWIVLLWLAFVLGPLPLRSVFSPWKPVDETALINASGRFYQAKVRPADAARRLIENFFNGVRRKLNLSENGEPLWEWLGKQTAVSNDERALLQRLFAQAHADRRIELTRLQHLLTDIQGKLV